MPINLFKIFHANYGPLLEFVGEICFAKNEQGFFKYEIKQLKRNLNKKLMKKRIKNSWWFIVKLGG
jgi:hypothetical protein